MERRDQNPTQVPRRLPLGAAIAAVVLGLGGHAVADPASQPGAEQQQQSGQYSSPIERTVTAERSSTVAGAEPRTTSTGDRQAEFKLLDQNRDGALSKSELKAKRGIDADETMQQLDEDRNEQLSRVEFAAYEDRSADSTKNRSVKDRSMASSSSATSDSSSDDDDIDRNDRKDSLNAVAKHDDSLSNIVAALETAGMGDALSESSYTLFAPTNEAFKSASGKSLDELQKEENRDELVSLLRAHIVADDVEEDMARNIPQARTIDGGTVDLTSEDGKLRVGDAKVVETSFKEGSLRVYPIDKVLTPDPDRDVASAGERKGSSDSAAGDSRFRELDRNQDGYLSESELDEAGGLSGSIADGTLDADDDGRVSRSEFAAVEGIASGSSADRAESKSDSVGSSSGHDSGSKTRDAWQTPQSEYDDSTERNDEQPQ